uniref:Uncharacterized protein n=1 Tax=Trypanosoma vivax (strain Y486) TaxID=1055687 RepID=G0U534_TRYVY|nr:conserved hypothetical protein [Trypanosoma vivax Y486]
MSGSASPTFSHSSRVCEGNGVLVRGIARLPIEILQRIFMDFIESYEKNFSCVGVLSSVNRQWYCACQHTLICKFAAKKIFVAYPLVHLLTSTSTGPLETCALKNRWHADQTSWRSSAQSFQALCEAMKEVKLYETQRSFCEYVKRRRAFVLHAIISFALLCFSTSLFIVVCLAEGIQFRELYRSTNVFILLWATYAAFFASVISNVVMVAHFEPVPLLTRLRKNKLLIQGSCLAVAIVSFSVVLPTILFQVNLSRRERFDWLWCGAAPISVLMLWQLYVLFSAIDLQALKPLLRARRVDWRPRIVLTNLALSIPYTFPLWCATTIFTALRYVDHRDHIYIVISALPPLVAFSVLSVAFFIDFIVLLRIKHLITSVALLFAALSPLSLMLMEFRGLCLLPLTVASFIFFTKHMQLMTLQSLKQLIDELQRNKRSTR